MGSCVCCACSRTNLSEICVGVGRDTTGPLVCGTDTAVGRACGTKDALGSDVTTDPNPDPGPEVEAEDDHQPPPPIAQSQRGLAEQIPICPGSPWPSYRLSVAVIVPPATAIVLS